jgi:hypothetical protein
MSSKRFGSIKSALILMAVLLWALNVSQARGDELFFVSGTVESISKDLKSIEVNEGRVLISPETKIVDEKEKPLGLTSLQQKPKVTIQVLRRSNGFYAQKIVVKTPLSKP